MIFGKNQLLFQIDTPSAGRQPGWP